LRKNSGHTFLISLGELPNTFNGLSEESWDTSVSNVYRDAIEIASWILAVPCFSRKREREREGGEREREREGGRTTIERGAA
jgi:hypothetical protein